VADALQRRVDAFAAGELADATDGLLAALGDDVGAAAMLPTALDRSCHAEAEVADEPRSSRYRLNSGDGEVRIHGRGG
jgi:hypothetical protein